jgi:hypothetical protein
LSVSDIFLSLNHAFTHCIFATSIKKKIMKNFRKTFIAISTLLLLCLTLFNACKPVREFRSQTIYKGSNNFNWQQPAIDTAKKNVFIVADNDGTELF